MPSQDTFMVAAPIRAGATRAVRELLATMNERPGTAAPHNALFPFARFPELHFARWVVLSDITCGDLGRHGLEPPSYPDTLAFLGDCDGSADALLGRMALEAGPGLRQLFAHCEGANGAELSAWMRQRSLRPAAAYVHAPGRSVRQAREEARLRSFLEDWLDTNETRGRSASELHAAMRRAVVAARERGELELSPREPPPSRWRETAQLIAVVLLALLAAPFLLLALPFFLWFLRRRETTDPVVDLAAPEEHVRGLQELEDHAVTNQFTALGSVKPGLFRRLVLRAALFVVGVAARHVYVRGRLGRVSTIHCARWVYLDQGCRMVFASNYDGSLDSYMEDFINKVGFGLNLVFGNGVGYPRTRFLVLDGAADEQGFKRFIRRHQVPTDVYYNAHAGRTAVGMDTASAIRRGFENDSPTEAEAAAWLALFH